LRGSIGAWVVVCLLFAALGACGGKGSGFGSPTPGGGPGATSDGGSGGGDDATDLPILDGSVPILGDGFAGDAVASTTSANGVFTAPDCAGCKFPDTSAPSCAASAPVLRIAYPVDGVLLPPNMSTLSVQWTPFGKYTTYEVDFSNSVTDTRVITKCSSQTMDTAQPPAGSGGCELVLSASVWTFLSTPNRGGTPVKISVRGTTDGKCASSSVNSVNVSFAEEDLLGDIYYWKSTVTSTGTGGQIWVKSFGDSTPEQQITGPGGWVLAATCNGCHALSRDGLRMVVSSDDADSDDEYGDLSGSLIDMKAKKTLGVTPPLGIIGIGGQPPGFSTISPSHTLYLSSDGANTSPTNAFALWDGNAGMTISNVSFGATTDRPTMPDWSADGTNVVYVLPNKVATWDGVRSDDDHEYGGSIYTMPYMGNQMFGKPTPLIASSGENNYYPSYSPDGQFIVFDRAPQDKSAGSIDGCVTMPHPACPNDSFSNPAARLVLTPGTAAAPIDLERANGSPAANPQPLSNSWPRWSPFVQSYKGSRLLWVAFSSTRDYGVRVRNHQPGMYQCYPPDSAEQPGAAHGLPFDPLCQQPKLWMAAINLSEGQGGDPSFPAFYLPFQDITTHNHTPQWTQQVVNPPPPPPKCVMAGGSCANNPAACCPPAMCTGNGTCGQIVQ